MDGKRVFAHHGLTADKARSYEAEDFGDGVVGFVLEQPDETGTGEPAPPKSTRTAKAQPKTQTKKR